MAKQKYGPTIPEREWETTGTILNHEVEYRGLDPETLQPKVLGQVVLREFQDQQLARVIFQSASENVQEDDKLVPKEYALGATRSLAPAVLDPLNVLGPIIEAGFEPDFIHYKKGGYHAQALLHDPNIRFQDVISWDRELLAGVEGLKQNADPRMEMALYVQGPSKTGTYNLQVGFFRLICTNGLFDTGWDMGEIKLKPGEYIPDAFQTWLTDRRQAITSGDFEIAVTDIPVDALPFVANLWRTYSTKRVEVGPNDAMNAMAVPDLIANEFRQVMIRPPMLMVDEVVRQMETIAASKLKTVNNLDVLNALTNAANLTKIEDARVQQLTDRMYPHLMNMLILGAFMSGKNVQTKKQKIRVIEGSAS